MELTVQSLWNPKRQVTEVNLYFWEGRVLKHSAVGVTRLKVEKLNDLQVTITGLVFSGGVILLDQIIFSEDEDVETQVSFPSGTFKHISGQLTIDVRFEVV